MLIYIVVEKLVQIGYTLVNSVLNCFTNNIDLSNLSKIRNIYYSDVI